MICKPASCNCAIDSSTLTVSTVGNTILLETYEGVATSSTRPGSPSIGMRIYETDTGRVMLWDGTNWIWQSGNPPRFQIEAQSAQSINDSTETTVALSTEVEDTDGFHTSTNGFVTIPTGWGGTYSITIFGQWASSATGIRYMRPVIASNASTTQNNGDRIGGYTVPANVLNGYPETQQYRLEAGATVTLRAYQSSGGSLDLNACALKGFLIAHDPTLT